VLAGQRGDLGHDLLGEVAEMRSVICRLLVRPQW
jgi:hypothetical protein